MGNSDVIEKWQAKVRADITRWERIRNKEAPSGHERAYGEDAGTQHVLGQGGINDLWRSWTENYSELVKLSTKATKEYSATELAQIYGVTAPIKPE